MATQKDEKVEKLEKLEAGFNVYVNGAHQKPARHAPRYTLTKSSGAGASSASASGSHEASRKFFISRRPNTSRLEASNLNQYNMLLNAGKVQAVAKKTTERKKWNRCSFILKTEEGYEIKISAPKPGRGEVKPASAHETRNKKKNDSNDYYSDDFESDESDREEQQSSTTTATTTTTTTMDAKQIDDEEIALFDKELMASVNFSEDDQSSGEDSSISEEMCEDDDDGQKKQAKSVDKNEPTRKKFVFNLNKKDIKVEYIFIFHFVLKIV